MPAAFGPPHSGIELTFADGLLPVVDQYLHRSLGITLLGPPEKGQNDGRPMVLRVGLVQEDAAADADSASGRLIGELGDVPVRRESVQVGAHRGVAVTGVPGRAPATYVFLTAHGRLYEIIYGGGALDRQADDLLSGLVLTPGSQARSVEAPLPRAADVLRQPPPAVRGGAGGRRAANADGAKNPQRLDPERLARGGSVPRDLPRDVAADGCADWPDGKFIQTPWTNAVNGGTGRAPAGPSYYGESFHVGCNRVGRLNDNHALDFAFQEGDPILAPAAGKVVWAGWASGGWASLGRIVVVDLGDGFWSMAAHLSSIEVAAGDPVKIDTVIGRAGGSGHQRDGFWGVHLHQGLYLNPRFVAANGGIHSGQSVQPHNVVHFGDGGGKYRDIEDGQMLSF